MPSVDQISRELDSFAPPALAAEWDNTGLLLGDAALEVHRVMTCLTLTRDVAEEAIASNVQLIVTHHPILFKAIKNLSSQNRDGHLLLRLARAGIAVYSPHTRFDNAVDGINARIARQLGLEQIQPLRIRTGNDQYKLVVFVPETDLERVSRAMFDAGAGQIGEYSECSFRLPGVGTFRGSPASNPTIGTKENFELVAEIRLEVICQARLLESIVSAMCKAHSYEEPAYDLYPLKTVSPRSGEGRLGCLPEKQPFESLFELAKKIFHVQQLQIVGGQETPIRKVAIACGAAGEFLSDALRKRADLFITGEMRFHELLAARTAGIAVLMPGHYASERPAIEQLAEWLSGKFPGIQAFPSRCESDPLRYA
jgi:dinuclear metal center YbgI/SA1388 family protein